jgi:hypothetical protein
MENRRIKHNLPTVGGAENPSKINLTMTPNYGGIQPPVCLVAVILLVS